MNSQHDIAWTIHYLKLCRFKFSLLLFLFLFYFFEGGGGAPLGLQCLKGNALFKIRISSSKLTAFEDLLAKNVHYLSETRATIYRNNFKYWDR